MHIERIHTMIECLTEKALGELDKGVENVNTEENGAKREASGGKNSEDWELWNLTALRTSFLILSSHNYARLRIVFEL